MQINFVLSILICEFEVYSVVPKTMIRRKCDIWMCATEIKGNVLDSHVWDSMMCINATLNVILSNSLLPSSDDLIQTGIDLMKRNCWRCWNNYRIKDTCLFFGFLWPQALLKEKTHDVCLS